MSMRETTENRVLNAVEMMQNAGMTEVQIKEVVSAIAAMVAFEASETIKKEFTA